MLQYDYILRVETQHITLYAILTISNSFTIQKNNKIKLNKNTVYQHYIRRM